ncbi:hypothetical protein [Burkholderia sp. Bp8992]|uniref:hypothetical protein n=1 Tax=Burkholderia sp. Bp8992 TaxID=2184554 RepID=UPI000F583BDB|nr:hypothetical protein [Burkholderia sp. Bp8992]
MSFEVHAYLGIHQFDLDRRVLQRLAAHGYKIELPPGRSLRSTSGDGTLWLAVLEIPPDFPRIERETAFFAGFGYEFFRRTSDSFSYAPRGVRKFEHVAYSRTSAGTPLGARHFQHLIVAALAAESNGWCVADGDETGVSGVAAFDKVCAGIRAAGNELDCYAPRFKGWRDDGQPLDEADIISPPERPRFAQVPARKKKWWRLWA